MRKIVKFLKFHFVNQRLMVQESLNEISLRGGLGILLLLSAYYLDRDEIGTYNLASSIAVIASGLLSGGWIYRITGDGSRKLSINVAIFQILIISSTVTILSNAFVLTMSFSNFSLFLFALNTLYLNSLCTALLEVMWAYKKQRDELLIYSRNKLLITVTVSILFILWFLLNPNIVTIIVLQLSVNVIVLIHNSKLHLNYLMGFVNLHLFSKFFISTKQWADSFKLILLSVVSMATFVMDNLFVASKFGIARLPEYTIGFATISLAIGMLGTPLQRILSISTSDVTNKSFAQRVIAITVLICGIMTCLLICLNQIRNNEILAEAIKTAFLLFPFAISKIYSMILSIRLGQNGKLLNVFKSHLIYLGLFAFTFLIFPKWADIELVACLTSLYNVMSTLYLFKRYRLELA